MRDIKCRGLTMNGDWVYGSLVVTNAFLKHRQAQHTKNWIVASAFGNGRRFNIRTRYYVKDESVGQFTGLQDKNGVDIYEGDILSKGNVSFNVERGVVKIIHGCWMVSNEGGDNYYNLYHYISGVKVIGNIHEIRIY